MTTEVLRFADLPLTRWRNGGGTTREVAAAPGSGGAGFDWRVSIADVTEPGAFSTFPGVDRVIALLEGDQLVLTVDGVDQVLHPHEPFTFAGESVTTCALPDGHTRDLNLMTARAHCRGSMVIVPLGEGRPLSLNGVRVLVTLTGVIHLHRPGQSEVLLDPLDALVCADTEADEVHGSGSVAVVRVAYRP